MGSVPEPERSGVPKATAQLLPAAEMPKTMDIPTFSDIRGFLGVLENPHVPFNIQRVYFLYGSTPAHLRGEHAHRALHQLMFAVAGCVSVSFDDGLGNVFSYTLDNPRYAILVPPGLWRRLQMTEDAVCIVLASRPFEEFDYIRDYEEFRSWKKSHSSN